jgi:hypothetical protein
MPQVELELTIPLFELAKTVHALDSADTAIVIIRIMIPITCTPSKELANLLLVLCHLADAHFIYYALYSM